MHFDPKSEGFKTVGYLAGLTLLPFLIILVAGHTLGPWDQIQQMGPWYGASPSQPWDVLQADGVLQFYGWRSLVLESWSHLQVPFWNPYELMGTPLLANSQSAGLYPPLVLLGVLHVPVGFAVLLLGWLHLALAALGAAKLSRVLGANEDGARIAGVLFGLSTFLVSWSGLSSVPYTCAWIPWAIALMLELRSGDKFYLTTSRLAGAVAMMLLAGHLQFAAFGIIAILLAWASSLFVSDSKSRILGGLGGAMALALGAGVAAPQVLPVLSYSKYSHRKTVATSEGFEAYKASAIKPFEFANLGSPFALGDPKQFWTIEKPKASSYWPPIVKRGANFAESAVTLGVLGIVLLAFAPLKRRKTWPVLAIGAVGLLIATASPLAAALYFGVPGWASTGSPGRAIVLFIMAAASLAGVGWSNVQEGGEKASKTALLLAIGSVVFFGLAALGGLQPEANFLLSEGATKGMLWWLLGLVIAGICITPQVSKKVGPWAFAIAALPQLAFAIYFIPHGSPLESPQKPSDSHARIAVINSNWDILTAQPALLPPNIAGQNGIHELTGYDSLLHVDTVNMLKEINGQDPSPPANGNMMFLKPNAKLEILGEYGVTELWSQTRDADGKAKFASLKIPGPGRVSCSGGTATIVSESLNAIEIKAVGPGTLTIRDRNIEGWKATVDGALATIKPGRWIELELPSGEHEVTLSYTAPAYDKGLVIGLVSFLIILGWLFVGLKSGKTDS